MMARAGKATRRSRVGRIVADPERGHYCTVHGRTARVKESVWVCSMNPRCRPLVSGL